ncbi:MAG TPA: hypothetical protein QKA37_00100, partial [Candidatus Megaira endosymbiont of Stentor roeselii]|nr:hypothetical protein [Candidatus Megaera endosymbiont of Stentor roeselii]
SAPKAKNPPEQDNIHRASAKLLDHVKDIPPMLHRSTVQFNTSQLAKNMVTVIKQLILIANVPTNLYS